MIGLFAISITACNQIKSAGDYEKNKVLAQEYFQTFVDQDFEKWNSMTSDSLKHQSPFYGEGQINKEAASEETKFYMTKFKDVTFSNAIWLPGVDNTTLIPNGGVRVYGTWSGTSIDTEKAFSINSYHWLEFNADGKVAASGEFFDATGMVMAVAPDPEEAEESQE